MIALLKYGTGMPFNRLERLEGSLGIPLPATTPWDIVDESGDQIEPALDELIRQAAPGQIFHNDDTGMKVLTLMAPARAAPAAQSSERKSVSTSSILSVLDGHRIALFFTGHRNAGENLTVVLQQRAAALERPLHMCDALPQNLPDLPPELQMILAHCLTHARRRFVDVAVNFPEECLYVLQALKVVYTNDALTKEQGLSAQERLEFHQAHSQATMDALQVWLTAQLEEKKVEPNSGLGQAITYMLKHWEPLTLFLHQPAAPLDNNVCERALKMAILHRKNAYFYKTENGARVGDLFMSLIHTCELNGVNPLDYLTQLLQHPNELAAHPADWMPWNYRETLQTLAVARTG
jgi:transposase